MGAGQPICRGDSITHSTTLYPYPLIIPSFFCAQYLAQSGRQVPHYHWMAVYSLRIFREGKCPPAVFYSVAFHNGCKLKIPEASPGGVKVRFGGSSILGRRPFPECRSGSIRTGSGEFLPVPLFLNQPCSRERSSMAL